jgi:hypothetical protein
LGDNSALALGRADLALENWLDEFPSLARGPFGEELRSILSANPSARVTAWAPLRGSYDSELYRTLMARRADWAERRPRLKKMGAE